jgi:putative colanic acid biosynthesis acetyltransferase WcaF
MTNMSKVDISRKPSPHGKANRLMRLAWLFVWTLLFRPSPRPCLAWRRFLLRLFGAHMAPTAKVHNSVVIWAPWNLTMDEEATLAPRVDCYCVAPIRIGAHTTVSQYSYLCAATHDFEHPRFPLVPKPITIEDQVWVAADVFVGPGVTIHQGAVVGARSSVFSDIPAWQVAVGSPAKPVRPRVIRSSGGENPAITGPAT